ncbi:MAG: cell wall-binding repeat-containing protein [Peptostreptococcus sp.]|uniref:cell wall-binding repeat-containing protein n=1 Tax=Peptostreptococcus sp. TaxID=1262 RepID=UPI002FC825A8
MKKKILRDSRKNNRKKGIVFLSFVFAGFLMNNTLAEEVIEVHNGVELKQKIQSASEGDTLLLSNDFDFSDLVIDMPNVNITIDGNGITNTKGFLRVQGNNNSQLEIKNLKFKGEEIKETPLQARQNAGTLNLENIELSESNKGAMSISSGESSKVILSKVNIHDNEANNTAPAIFLGSDANLEINNSTIKNNRGYGGGYETGAISSKFYKSNLSINNTVFEKNINDTVNTGVTGGGGGAMSMNYLKGNIEINESYFKENETSGKNGDVKNTYDGGAIYIFDGRDGANFKVSNSTFDSNVAYDDGGAMMIQGTGNPGLETKIVNTTFYGNKAYGLDGANVSGGAIQYFKNGGSSKMTNQLLSCTFVGNQAGNEQSKFDQKGGAVSLSGAGIFANATVSRNDSIFIGNKVFNSKGEEDKSSTYKDISNSANSQYGKENIINLDKGINPEYTVEDILGKKNIMLTSNHSNVIAGMNDEIVKTIAIKPEGLADNQYGDTVVPEGRDQRNFARYKDDGSIEMSWIKYNANSGEFKLDDMQEYNGFKYYDKNENGIIENYYSIGSNNTKTKIVKNADDLKAVKSGFELKGWSKDKDATSPDSLYDFDKDIDFDNDNITLYAVWGKKDDNGGGNGGGGGSNINKITLVGGPLTLTKNIENQLYDFKLDRLSGKDRYETSIEVSKKYNNRDTVILSSGEKYTDELTATVLANKLDVPILLIRKDEVPRKTLEEIKRLGGKNIIIVGEKETISKNVEKILSDYNLERVGGSNRYETAVLLGEKLGNLTNKRNRVILVDGTNFPDAIAMTSKGVEESTPILLTEPNNLNNSTKKAFEKWSVSDVIIGGGPNSVSSSIENELKKNKNVERISGKDRYETSVKVASNVYKNPTHAVLASGEVFPDAIVGAPYAAKYKYPIVLSQGNDIPKVVKEYVGAE